VVKTQATTAQASSPCKQSAVTDLLGVPASAPAGGELTDMGEGTLDLSFALRELILPGSTCLAKDKGSGHLGAWGMSPAQLILTNGVLLFGYFYLFNHCSICSPKQVARN
jgi:hypothetical protein